MRATKKHRTKDQVSVLISPIYMVDTKEHYGLFSTEEIVEGNELKMYYVACEKILKFISRASKRARITINIILNEYTSFAEEDLYMLFTVMKDVLSTFDHLKMHFFDEESAKEEGVIT